MNDLPGFLNKASFIKRKKTLALIESALINALLDPVRKISSDPQLPVQLTRIRRIDLLIADLLLQVSQICETQKRAITSPRF